MGRMKDIAINFDRVQKLANQLIYFCERVYREPRGYNQIFDEVAEIARKLVDCVREE